MTIDDRPRNPGGRGEGRTMGSPRSTRRDLERYAGLFAARTKVMTSSAMRDLMAITERDEVISLAGGLPDTSTFPPDSYAAIMAQVAAESSARALQYGPTEGLEALKSCVVEVMAAEGMAAIDPDEVPLPTLRSIDGGEFVVYLGTFSKILSPGVRLGWTVAPRPVLEKMNMGKQSVDLCSSPMTQYFVATYFAQDGSWADYLRSLREIY